MKVHSPLTSILKLNNSPMSISAPSFSSGSRKKSMLLGLLVPQALWNFLTDMGDLGQLPMELHTLAWLAILIIIWKKLGSLFADSILISEWLLVIILEPTLKRRLCRKFGICSCAIYLKIIFMLSGENTEEGGLWSFLSFLCFRIWDEIWQWMEWEERSNINE